MSAEAAHTLPRVAAIFYCGPCHCYDLVLVWGKGHALAREASSCLGLSCRINGKTGNENKTHDFVFGTVQGIAK